MTRHRANLSFVTAVLATSLFIRLPDAHAQNASPETLLAGRIVEGADLAMKTIGEWGCLVIRTPSRLEAVRSNLVNDCGVNLDTPHFSGIDFAHSALVWAFEYGDEQDAFSAGTFTTGEDISSLDLVMAYTIYKAHAPKSPTWNFILVKIPVSKRLQVSVSTYHPHNEGPHPTPDKAYLEWRGMFTADTGDVVSGLRAAIRPKSATVKAGEDIGVSFELRRAPRLGDEPGRFAHESPSLYVWDGKYSNGYRNHAFEVALPNGTIRSLRPPVISDWLKNAPHLVDVAENKPYVLPGWGEGEAFKSLKTLGLDTSQPGTYRITGIYAETAGDDRPGMAQPGEKPRKAWGGNISTGGITVEVTK